MRVTSDALQTNDAFSLSVGTYGLAIVRNVVSWFLLRHVGRRRLYLGGLLAMLITLLARGGVEYSLSTSVWIRAIQVLKAYSKVRESAERCVAALEILLAKIQGRSHPQQFEKNERESSSIHDILNPNSNVTGQGNGGYSETLMISQRALA